MSELGKLQLVDIRKIWTREDEDFTPWLFKQENLNQLANVLNMKLKPVGKEVEVGQYYTDILCRNTDNNSLIVIENQLEESDHDHLGKVLTYATESGADTVVWIATDFTKEHRNTFDWLNQNMSDEFQFFCVKIELIQVDDSPLAPKFTVISKPANWRPKIIEGDWRPIYWSKLREHLTVKNSFLEPGKWNEDRPDYLGFDIGKSPLIWMSAWLNPKGKQIAVNLHLKGQNAKTQFDELYQQQEVVKDEFGAGLKWYKSPKFNPSVPQVGLYKNNTDPKAELDWQNQFEWLRSNLEKLDKVFRLRISEF